ncbi:angiopoietin-related protein 4 [Protopterus annectens]|uniref:angiopoietin-related protein 4 n=1 Tax=Protopterus annectens TaxID=7888 RepID=UPI001CF95BCD|nr:angiopoietin-related protein 4 [Protopterus annectens]
MKTFEFLVLVLLIKLLFAFPSERKGTTGKEKKVQYASWDELNVLAHGLLQLGHGLKEHVDKTKGQMKEVFSKFNAHNSTLSELLNQVKQVRNENENLVSKATQLERKDAYFVNLSAELKEKVQELQGEQMDEAKRLKALENKVKGHTWGQAAENESAYSINMIQSIVEAQNKKIDELLDKVRLQQHKLDKQNVQIQSLQSQVENKFKTPKWRAVFAPKVEDAILDQNITSMSTESERLPSDCHQIFLEGHTESGVYRIEPVQSQPFEVYCEMTSDGGWTVLQRRLDGSVDFDRFWDSYENGFGNLNGEFWLGLDKMYRVARQGGYILHIRLTDWEDNSQFIEYPFHLGAKGSGYTLDLQSPVSGELENAVGHTRGVRFSTQDVDQDLKSDMNCAKHLSGGWWFTACGHSNLNGKYFTAVPRMRHERKQGIFWKTWKGRYYPLKSTLMKIRPAELEPES